MNTFDNIATPRLPLGPRMSKVLWLGPLLNRKVYIHRPVSTGRQKFFQAQQLKRFVESSWQGKTVRYVKDVWKNYEVHCGIRAAQSLGEVSVKANEIESTDV